MPAAAKYPCNVMRQEGGGREVGWNEGIVVPHQGPPLAHLLRRWLLHMLFPFASLWSLRVKRFVLPRPDGPSPNDCKLPIMTEGPCQSENL